MEGGMKLRTYRAASIADALADIKRDLGSDAVILHTRTFKAGGVLGLGARRHFEITATSAESVAPRRPRTPVRRADDQPAGSATRSAGEALLRQAYSSGLLSREGERAARDADARARAVRDEVRLASGAIEKPVGDAPLVTSTPLMRPTTPAPEPSHAAVAVATPTPPSRPVVAPPSQSDVAIASELASLKRLVGQVLTRTGRGAHAPAMPETLFKLYTQMLEAELADELADEVVAQVARSLDEESAADETLVREAVRRELAAMIPTAPTPPAPKRAKDGRPLTIALVGPTGVGKTTTIAKLAATYKLRKGKSVGLIASDTYRIAAVDQLRTYANIIGLPLEVAMTPADMKAACRRLSQRDVILIDTAGRSPSDETRLAELGEFLAAANPHETHLVLSSASSEKTMVAAAERFGVASPDRVIFTKLDESVGFGVIVGAARRIGIKMSFLTTGQEVPDHLEPGRPDRLASMILSGDLEGDAR
jgi:flagellar biosynthesis protein FlhF